MVTSKDENLTKSHIRFLESHLIREIGQADRVVLDNGNEPEPPPLPEADRADMEYFLTQVRLLLPVLGFNLMQRLTTVERPTHDQGQEDESPLFEMTPIGLHAQMRIVGGEFVVLKGSTARKKGLASWTSYRSLREQLVEDDTLVDADDPEQYVFARDCAFASPSAAAAIVIAGNQNGPTAWKHRATGCTYKDWQDSRLEAAGVSDDPSEGEVAPT